MRFAMSLALLAAVVMGQQEGCYDEDKKKMPNKGEDADGNPIPCECYETCLACGYYDNPT